MGRHLGVESGFAESGPAGDRRPGAFPRIDRDDVARSLEERLQRPGKIHQRGASLCGPACLFFNLATDRPRMYESFVWDLYNNGVAMLGKLRIAPGEDCRNYNPTGKINPVDWIALAGLRDSENSIFDYDETSDEIGGVTRPGELEDWFRAAGYQDVRNETNLVFTKDESCFRDACSLLHDGYRVCLLINATALEPNPENRGFLGQSVSFPNHWVVLRRVFSRVPENVRFSIFTWGTESFAVPQGTRGLTMGTWLQNFYGYVAAR